jgi:predicted Zn-dependent protease
LTRTISRDRLSHPHTQLTTPNRRDFLKTGAAAAAALTAPRLSRGAQSAQKRPVVLAPAPAVTGTWMTPITRDSLDVSIEEKVALLFATNEAALKVKGCGS